MDKINVFNRNISTLKYLISMTSKRRMGSSVRVLGGIFVIQLIVKYFFVKKLGS